MFEAMDEGKMTTAYCVGENPAQSEADSLRTVKRLSGLDHLVVQDIFLTRTAKLADVVFPAAANWCESEGTVTNSERRVQRVRKALDPPGQARDDISIISELARRMGHDWPATDAEGIWDELRSLSPIHAGMSYARLEELHGIQWPCYSEDRLEPPYLHGRLWNTDPAERGAPAPFAAIRHSPPVDLLDEEFPLRLTTGRRLSGYNTGVQSGQIATPLLGKGSIEVSREDARRLGLSPGDSVRVTSRRASLVAPVVIEPGLRPGLAFMTAHFPDEVDTNSLTIEATDPLSGTAEYKATAIRIDKVGRAV
jgi:predicted molibdopterin-dependent oxidoreductase YjgC